MIDGILGKKIGMTQIFKDTGDVVPVTVIEAGPCVVLQVKSPEKDGYTAVQLGFGEKRANSANKPREGVFKKANTLPLSFIRELRISNVEGIKPSDKITADLLKPGEYVDVTGTSIGKGFQGGVKRWHWKGGPESHGSNSHRAPGSIGSTVPARVVKGHHLPGHMGHERVTIHGLEVVEIDKENNILLLKGAVPGPKGSYLVIQKTLKKRKVPRAIDPSDKKALNPLKKSKKMMKK
ncbi:50S ribosomal protein L3 [Candidatus Omnitrophota bacterium]